MVTPSVQVGPRSEPQAFMARSCILPELAKAPVVGKLPCCSYCLAPGVRCNLWLTHLASLTPGFAADMPVRPSQTEEDEFFDAEEQLPSKAAMQQVLPLDGGAMLELPALAVSRP